MKRWIFHSNNYDCNLLTGDGTVVLTSALHSDRITVPGKNW